MVNGMDRTDDDETLTFVPLGTAALHVVLSSWLALVREQQAQFTLSGGPKRLEYGRPPLEFHQSAVAVLTRDESRGQKKKLAIARQQFALRSDDDSP